MLGLALDRCAFLIANFKSNQIINIRNMHSAKRCPRTGLMNKPSEYINPIEHCISSKCIMGYIIATSLELFFSNSNKTSDSVVCIGSRIDEFVVNNPKFQCLIEN